MGHAGIEPATLCLKGRIPEFNNLLIFSKLWKESQLAFSDSSQFSMLWQIVERFSHTDSHTEVAILTALTRTPTGSHPPDPKSEVRLVTWLTMAHKHTQFPDFSPRR